MKMMFMHQWERIVVDSLKMAFKISSSARGAFRDVGLNVLQSKKRDKGGSEFLHGKDPANIFRK